MPDDETHSIRARPGETDNFDALIIGAGFAGLYQLYCLRDRLGLSVQLLEAADGVSFRQRRGSRNRASTISR